MNALDKVDPSGKRRRQFKKMGLEAGQRGEKDTPPPSFLPEEQRWWLIGFNMFKEFHHGEKK